MGSEEHVDSVWLSEPSGRCLQCTGHQPGSLSGLELTFDILERSVERARGSLSLPLGPDAVYHA